MPHALSRRKLLIGAAALGATASAGAILVATADAKAALLEFLTHSLPGVTIDEKSARECIEDFTSEWSNAKLQSLAAAWRVIGMENLAAMHDRFAAAPRHALTFFLTNSNFFLAADPRAERIVYVAKPPGTPCINPFANLDTPK